MKKLKLILGISALLMIGLAQKTTAQYYFYDNNHYDNNITFEVGGSLNIMNCLTDIGGRKGVGKKFVKDLNLGKTTIGGGAYLTATYQDKIALRLEAAVGKISADDKVLQSVKTTTFGRYERNLSFRSNITEFSAIAEFHPLYIINQYNEESDAEPPLVSPYLLAGVGFFSFKPQAKSTSGQWVDLQPLSTEGQGFLEYPDRKPYKLSQMNIPIGLGAKYSFGSSFNVRAEFVYRKLNTDYLDDVSTTYIDPTVYANYFTGAKLTNALLLNDRQYELDPSHITLVDDQRGNSKNKDAYFSFNIKLGYTFGREKIR